MRTIFLYFKNHKHRLATVALVFGFITDIITFRTINLALSEIILAAHLSIVAFSILILSLPRRENEGRLFSRVRVFLPIIQQYSMGNLLSAFLVLYSGSGSLSQSWPFYAVLVVAVVGNETLKLQKYRLPFTATLFFLNLLLFFALALPVATGSISVASFLLAVVAGTVVFQVFRYLLHLVARSAFKEYRTYISRGAFTVLVFLNVLYFTNLIPPIPLTLKDIGFYHNVARHEDFYVVEKEKRSFLEQFFDLDGTSFSVAPGQSAFVYTAIFAPGSVDTNAVHRWEYFNAEKKAWETRNVVRFPLVGGRRGGYRAHSLVQYPREGRWRVSVETTRGAVIGRAYATIIHADISPPILEEVKE